MLALRGLSGGTRNGPSEADYNFMLIVLDLGRAMQN